MVHQRTLFKFRRIAALAACTTAACAVTVGAAPSPAAAFSNFEIRAIPLEPVIAGSTADIEFRVYNAGPDESDDTLLEVDLPAGVTAVAGQTACVDPSSCLIGSFGLIPIGTSSSRVIRVAVDPDFVADNGGGAATANAAFPTQVDYDGGAQSATLQVPVGERSDLRIRKYGPLTADAGEPAVYQIDVDNLGPSTARDVVIQDTLFAELGSTDPGLRLDACAFSVALGGGLIEQFQCSSGPVVASTLGSPAGTFSTGTLQPAGLYPAADPGDPDYVGGRLRASFTLTALDAVAFDSEVRVVAATADPDPANNLVVTTTSFQAVADLGVAVAAAPATAAPGEPVTFTVDVTNDGPSAAHGVVVRDHLPGNVTVVSATSPNGACVSGTPGDAADPIVCLLGTIPSGGAATATVVARVAVTPAGASVANRAWVSSATADLVNTNDGAEAVVAVSGTPVAPGGLFNPVTPSRQFDTRDGAGGVPVGKLGAGEVLAFTVAGVNGIPAGVAAVALNVTVDDPSAAGWISVYPCALPPAVASSLNFTAGATVANAVIAPVDVFGQVCFRASASTHLISDVSGWFAAGGSLTTVTPAREFDTRSGHGGVPAAPLAGGVPMTFDVTGGHGVPATGVGAVLLNVTVTQADAAGHVTVYPCGALPLTSNGNYLAGESVGSFVVAPVSPDGNVCFVTSARAHLVVDVAGWLAAGSEHHPVNPSRLFDTRDGTGGIAAARLRAGDVFEFTVAGHGGIPSAGAASAILNLTAVGPDRPGYVTAFPCGDRPLSSNVNFTAGQVVANAVIAPVSPDGTVCFYTTAALDLIVDAVGWFSS